MANRRSLDADIKLLLVEAWSSSRRPMLELAKINAFCHEVNIISILVIFASTVPFWQ
jgi:hypothetical protein